jgi:hypothetical protein
MPLISDYRWVMETTEMLFPSIGGEQMHKIIDLYYQSRGITPGTYLAQDLNDRNRLVLRYVRYAIRLQQVKGIPYLLDDLANITDDLEQDCQKQLNREREYYNRLTEFHSIFLVHHQLGLQILAVESPKTKVESPKRLGNKSCDIHASDGDIDYFFEVKDASSEITKTYNKNGVEYFDAMNDTKINCWITGKCQEAIDKGANYLCCRVPIWIDEKKINNPVGKYTWWVKKIFPNAKKVGQKEFQVSLSLNNIPAFFKGFYIIKKDGLYLKFNLI